MGSLSLAMKKSYHEMAEFWNAGMMSEERMQNREGRRQKTE
jgi:hypothetical protein